jgi:hypothetical protein
MLGGEMPSQKSVFMAIAENCGHGRRGETRFQRGEDGEETFVLHDIVERWEHNGDIKSQVRKQKVRLLADDLPWIATQYRLHVAGKHFEAE